MRIPFPGDHAPGSSILSPTGDGASNAGKWQPLGQGYSGNISAAKRIGRKLVMKPAGFVTNWKGTSHQILVAEFDKIFIHLRLFKPP